MIVTLTDVKTFNLISVSTYDALINKLIPIVESKIIRHCNNEFIGTYETVNGIRPEVYLYSNTISFDDSDNSMNDSENDFTEKNFKVGDSVRVYNSLHNNKPLTISSIAENKIIFDSINTINNEDSGTTIIMARIDYPLELSLIASKMVKWDLEKNKKFLKSEKFDDYSYDRGNGVMSGYPESIINDLGEYWSMFLKTIPVDLSYYRIQSR